MSNNVFPILPAVQINKGARPVFSTKDLISVSGKRISVSWRPNPIIQINFVAKLRSWKYGPTGTWSTYTEPNILLAFFNTHKGKWDSFLVDNTTLLYYPAGAADATSLRVHFVSNELSMIEEQPGLYVANVSWESVL